MILTTKSRYAVMAIVEMAKSINGSVINLLHISDSQNIPHSYLEQLFIKLKRSGIVSAIRGPGGGYRLNFVAEEISIYSIIRAVEDDITIPKCGEDKKCSSYLTKCATHYLWAELENKVTNYLSKVFIADIINGKNLAPITGFAPIEKIYLDYNATTPLQNAVKNEMDKIFGHAMNPSSLHWHGRHAKALIENARNEVAKALGIKLGIGEYQITFTSSGTEANNLLLHNFAGQDALVSSVEHLSILDGAQKHANRSMIKVDSNGQINMDHLLDLLKTTQKGSLLSIIIANNETGIIQQDMQTIIKLAHEYGMFVHSDSVQGFGKVPLLLENIDFITISAHKIGGAIGAAALIHKSNFPFKSHIVGGGQERGIRSGTENVPAIVGFGKAAELVSYNMKRYLEIEILRDRMESMVEAFCSDATFYGKKTGRLPNTSMILMPGVDAQKQLIQFDLNDISLSAGSACSSGKMKTSHVLTAMGVRDEDAKCTIRVSLGVETKPSDIERFVEVWQRIYNTPRSL